MAETQASITAWALETFGPDGTDFRIVARANDELAELLRAVAGGGAGPAAICAEAADVVIVLARLAERYGFEMLRAERHCDGWPVAREAVPLAVEGAMRMAALLHLTTPHQPPVNADVIRYEGRRHMLAVAAVMWAICHTLGHDLHAEVDAKMAINRARQWRRDGAGCGYHVHVPERTLLETPCDRYYRMSVAAAAGEARSRAADARGAVVIHACAGIGTTRAAFALAAYYDKRRIVDEWDGSTPLPDDALALTDKPTAGSIGISAAALAMGIVDPAGWCQ